MSVIRIQKACGDTRSWFAKNGHDFTDRQKVEIEAFRTEILNEANPQLRG